MTQSGGTLIEGFTECGPWLIVAMDCLGRGYETSIAGHEVTVSFPSPPDPSSSQLRAPVFEISGRVTKQDWGSVGVKRNEIPLGAHVSAFRIAFNVEAEDYESCVAPAQLVVEAIGDWWTIVASWLAIVTDLDFQQLGQNKDAIVGPWLPLWPASETVEFRLIPVPDSMRTYVVPAIYRKQLPNADTMQKCLTLAGRNKPPPDEWLFIRDARSYFNVGETRRAVIDAATAAELAILVQIRRRLQILDTAERDALLYGYNGIMELDGLWRRLGGPTPWGKRERVMDRLAGPRNRASRAPALFMSGPVSWDFGG
jgi:hypothetical protein